MLELLLLSDDKHCTLELFSQVSSLSCIPTGRTCFWPLLCASALHDTLLGCFPPTHRPARHLCRAPVARSSRASHSRYQAAPGRMLRPSSTPTCAVVAAHHSTETRYARDVHHGGISPHHLLYHLYDMKT